MPEVATARARAEEIRFGEPVELLASLRSLAAVSPSEARTSAPSHLAAYAWERWREKLAPAGLELADVESSFESATWEIWLWIGGDRIWGQLGAQLVGRVLRRLPGAG